MCRLVFTVCARARPENEEQAWLQVKGWALDDCRLGSGFHFLSLELQVGSCTPCQTLYSTDSFVSSFYVLEAFRLRYWYFWRQTLNYFGGVSKRLYCASDVHLPEIHCLSKASLGPWILSFSLPAQPDADRKCMRVLVLDVLLCERVRIFVTSCLSPGWIPVAHCRQQSWRYPSSQWILTAQSSQP